MKLTPRKVAGFGPGDHGVGDNLWVIVSPHGRKRWEFRYSVARKAHAMSLGSVDLVTPDEARMRVLELRGGIANGRYPELMRRKSGRVERATTFREVAEDCIAAQVEGWKNGKSEGQWRQSLETYAYPTLGDMQVAAITTDDVYAVLKPIWATKAETAGRLRARMEKVFNRALARKLMQGDNPARFKGNLDHLLVHQSKVKRVKHHPALPFAEMAQFMGELRKREGVAARAFEFAILTAARTSEALGARWSEIDMASGVWTIPAERMKLPREHRVPLTGVALDLLKKLPREEDSDFVFISPMSKGQPMSNMALLATLKRMNRTDITAHGFRSTFRDWASETTSHDSNVVEMALAHAIGNAAEAAYRRGDLFEKRKLLMSDWASHCGNPPNGVAV